MASDDFEAFYLAHYGRLVGQLLAMLGDLAEAEDAVQEAFARASVRWRWLSAYDAPDAWVRRVAFSVARNSLRRARSRLRAAERLPPPVAAPAPTADLLDVLAAMRPLPQRQREALVLHYVAGLPVEEIARQLRVPAGTVKSGSPAAARRWPGGSARPRERRPAVGDHDLRTRLLGVAEFGERVAQPPPVGVVRRRGRRRTARLAGAALAGVLAVALAGVAVLDRADRDQVVTSTGSIPPPPLVSDLGPIVGAQLLDADAGWALTADRLAWTDDRGRSWRTITQGGAAGLDLLTAFFLDRRTGWLVAADLPKDGSPVELTAFRTGDGGATWRRSAMGPASVQQSEDGIGPMNLSFVDAGHGWLRVTSRLPGQRAEDETGTLLRTTDGGRTWERLPDAPTPGAVRFVGRRRGWQSWIDGLWETLDGGRSWAVVPTPPPVPGRDGRLEFAGLPTIFEDGTGFVPVVLSRAGTGRLAGAGFAETRDGGSTWGAPRLAPGTAGDSRFPILAVAGSRTLLALDGDQRTIASSDDGGRTWARRPTDLAGRDYAALYGMSFADATSGWLLSAFLSGCGRGCDSEGAVLGTRSAGRAWAVVLPGR